MMKELIRQASQAVFGLWWKQLREDSAADQVVRDCQM